jgi:F-box and leucine-rich repeat protein GRR1
VSPSLSEGLALTNAEFNEHQRDVFCVFSGLGVQRLRSYLNSEQPPGIRPIPGQTFGGTTYYDAGDTEMILNVTAQANGMAIEEDDVGNESELIAPSYTTS